MEDRYFCTIFAQSHENLIALNKYDVDVFQPTARRTERGDFIIEGLLNLEEVARLVDSGYEVLVEEHASKRARAAKNSISAKAWISAFEGLER
jgi:hypothetical protein